MKNNRNTLGQHWKPTQKNLGNSVDRKTMTNPAIITQPQPQSRQANLQLNVDKMCQKINKVMNKMPETSNKRNSISNNTHPKASTLFHNITVFLNYIDRNFQKTNVDIETIPLILNFWGYPHTFNKTVFQPIGAPHTWPTCLHMMQYLADISNYFFQYRSTMDEFKLDTEEIDLILQAYDNEDSSKINQYLQKQNADLAKQEEQLLFKIQSSQLTLRNVKNSQKSLTEMQTQQSILIQKLQRESQNVIEIDQRNNALISQIQKIDDHTEELQMKKASLLKKYQMMEEEINNQQLSAGQAAKIQSQIQEYNQRIIDAQTEDEVKKKQYEAQKEKIMESFYKIVDEINQVKNSIKTYQSELQARGIQMPMPQSDHVAFTQAIHTQDMNIFNQAIVKMLETDKIKAMLICQQSLADVLEHESKNMSNQLAQVQVKKDEADNEHKQVTDEVVKLGKCTQQIENQINQLTQKQSQTQQAILIIQQTSNELKKENQLLLQQQVEITQQTKRRKQQMMQGIKLLKKYDDDCDLMIKNIEQKEEELKKKIQNLLERIQGGFTFLSLQLESFL